MISALKQENPKLYQLTWIFMGFTCIYIALLLMRELYTKVTSESFLIWNLMLAWIPYGFSLQYVYGTYKSSVWKYIIGFLWLIFYPNAPYMLTDFIHICQYGFLRPHTTFFMWWYFFLISMFVFLGVALGVVSLLMIHRYVAKKHGESSGWIFVCMISLMSGFGIYLGRFLRLNSWNVITHPHYLVSSIVTNLSFHAIAFTGLFGILTLFVYLIFYVVVKLGNSQ